MPSHAFSSTPPSITYCCEYTRDLHQLQNLKLEDLFTECTLICFHLTLVLQILQPTIYWSTTINDVTVISPHHPPDYLINHCKDSFVNTVLTCSSSMGLNWQNVNLGEPNPLHSPATHRWRRIMYLPDWFDFKRMMINLYHDDKPEWIRHSALYI